MSMHVAGGLIMGFAVIMAVAMFGDLLRYLWGMPGTLMCRRHGHGGQNETCSNDRGDQLLQRSAKGGAAKKQSPAKLSEQQQQNLRRHGLLPDLSLPSAGSR
jgi:hypothetical protein